MPTAKELLDRYINKTEQDSALRKGSVGKVDTYRSDLSKQYDIDNRRGKLDSLRKQVSDTEQILSDLPGQIKQRTAGRLMTAGQTNRLRAKESEPLANTLGNIARTKAVEEEGFGNINNLINQLVGEKRMNINDEILREMQGTDDIFKAYQLASGAENDAFDRDIRKQDLNLRKSQLAAERQRTNYASQLDAEIAKLRAELGAKNSTAGGRLSVSSGATSRDLKERDRKYRHDFLAKTPPEYLSADQRKELATLKKLGYGN